MIFSDSTWERTAFLTRFDGSSTADMLAGLANAHFASVRLGPSMGSNVPDDAPKAITTGPILETGLGAVFRSRI